MSNRLFNVGKGFTQRCYDLLWTNEDPTAEFSGMVIDITNIYTKYPILAVVSLDFSHYYQNFEDIEDDGVAGQEALVRETTTMVFTKPDSFHLIQPSGSGDELVVTRYEYNYPQQITSLYEQHLYYRNVVLERITTQDKLPDGTIGGSVEPQFHVTYNLHISGELYNQSGNTVTPDEAQKRYIVPLYIYGIRGKEDDE